MTPAPWGRSHQEEYWTGCFRFIFIGLPIMLIVIVGGAQLIRWMLQ